MVGSLYAHAKWRGAAGPPWHQGSKNVILWIFVPTGRACWMRKCTLVSQACRANYTPCKRLQSGWLAHSTRMPSGVGRRGHLGNKDQKNVIVCMRVAPTQASWMRKYTLVTRVCRATYPPCKSLQSGWLAHSTRMPSGVGRRGHLGIKDRKTLYCVCALPKHKHLG